LLASEPREARYAQTAVQQNKQKKSRHTDGISAK